MGKQVIVTVGEENTRVFENLEAASAEIGASQAAISMSMREGRACKGVTMKYVDRVYLVRPRKEFGKWILAKLNGHNTAFCPFDQHEKSVKVKDIEEIKDITACWYR